MSYTLNWADGTKTALVIAPLVFDTTSTSVTLFGRGVSNFGQVQQNATLNILENFAAPTAPSNPVQGQTWYDNTVGAPKLNVYTGAAWMRVSPDPALEYLAFVI